MSAEHRRFWDERYGKAGADHLFGHEPSRFLVRHRDCLSGCRDVLAVADGEGRNSVWLARQGLAVTATEISPLALAKARAFAAAQGVAELRFIEVDVLDWDWPQAMFDAVVAVFVQFADPREREVLFAGMCAALRPGGVLLLHGYTPKQLDYGTGGPPQVDNLYTSAMLRTALAGLEISELVEYEAELTEGCGHVGRSALIDLVARKPRAGAD